jgi:hypothetical protein
LPLDVDATRVQGRWVKHAYTGSPALPLRDPPPDNRWQRVYLLLFASVAALLAVGALSNLWSGYQDSPTSTYLAIGVPALVAAVVAVIAAVRIWRDR